MNYTSKLQVIYRIMLDTYADDKFIIRLSSEEIFSSSIYKILESYTKNDIMNLNNHIRNLQGSTIVIDYTNYTFDDIDRFLTSVLPNLDASFKSKMINNFELIETTVNDLSLVDSLSVKKINEYLDNHYKKNVNLYFLKLFDQVDTTTMKQLELLKKDKNNDGIIQEIMTDFYPLFIERKPQELLTNTIGIQELIMFKAD